jgi:hypothetical protein
MGRKSSAERREAVNCEGDDFCRSFNGLNVVNEAMSRRHREQLSRVSSGRRQCERAAQSVIWSLAVWDFG